MSNQYGDFTKKVFDGFFIYIHVYVFVSRYFIIIEINIRGESRHFHKGGGGPFFLEKISDFKAICFKKNQKMPRRNLKRKLQIKVKRKMTRTKLEMFC